MAGSIENGVLLGDQVQMSGRQSLLRGEMKRRRWTSSRGERRGYLPLSVEKGPPVSAHFSDRQVAEVFYTYTPSAINTE